MTKEQIERAIQAIIQHAQRGGAYEMKVHDLAEKIASDVAPNVMRSDDYQDAWAQYFENMTDEEFKEHMAKAQKMVEDNLRKWWAGRKDGIAS
jgi:hypothetical protein